MTTSKAHASSSASGTSRLGTRLLWISFLGAFLICASSSGACGDKKSAIMLAVTTDMKAPKDVNAVSVTVSTNNAVKHNVIGRVTPQGDILLPATLAIVEPEDPNASVRIRVMAFQERRARVLRDVRTSIPSGGRVALLRIPLNFVNDGSTQGELLDDVIPAPNPNSSSSSSGGAGSPDSGKGSSGVTGGDLFDPFTFVPNCPNPEHTWIDGECKDAYVDPATLPDFDESQVGSGDQAGSCFDVRKCFADAASIGEDSEGKDGAEGPAPRDGGVSERDLHPRSITLDRTGCSIALNGADASQLNLALVTPDTGECIRPNQCYIPLDSGAGGWKADNGQIKLPAFVCKLLKSKNLQLHHSVGCAAKKEANPICLDKAPPPSSGGPRLLVAGAFPSAVVDNYLDVYFAGADRVGHVALSSSADPVVTSIEGIQPGKFPWAFSGTVLGEGPFIEKGFILTSGTTAYVNEGGLREIRFPAEATITGAVHHFDGNFYFGATGAAGGIYTTSGDGAPHDVEFAPRAIDEASAIAFNTHGFVYGTSTGHVVGCATLARECGADNAIGPGPVDALLISGGTDYGYALLADGLYRLQHVSAEHGGMTGEIAGTKLADAPTAGVRSDEKYFRHALTRTERCVFFTSALGVHWVAEAGGKSGLLASPPSADRPTLGVSVHNSRFRFEPRIYYTVFAPLDQGGGVYVVDEPAECRGAASSSSAGGLADAGAVGGDDDPTPECKGFNTACTRGDECCSKSCDAQVQRCDP